MYMTDEQLKAKGFEPLNQDGFINYGDYHLYWIHPCGDIYGVRRKRILKPSDNGLGYMNVYLTYAIEGGKNFKVHRLVAMQFIPNPNNLSDVNHKNGIKDDNRVENLEWLSHSDNILHSFRTLGRVHASSHLSKRIYCSTNGKVYSSAKEAASDTGCQTPNISMCCNGKSKHTKGFKFTFENTNDTDKKGLLDIYMVSR